MFVFYRYRLSEGINIIKDDGSYDGDDDICSKRL